ncbi:MAG: hypothetical protein SOI44_04825 [Lactimicrobium sp.]|jgi:NAD-dependent SIR2 family protein deacetylase|uniref:SIR2 family NAD-dependent protein deacylase n=1 Tax=Lactimicrobium sp. TaxID=2563780 RepID=UPI002F3571D0
MNSRYLDDGYHDTIQMAMEVLPRFESSRISTGRRIDTQNILQLKHEIETADAIVIGAGAGLSASAGMTYSGERFERYFFDFAKTFGIQDMYSGGFYPFPDNETKWAWWARAIYINRYVDAPKPVYEQLKRLVEGKDYFVITTNVDHLFQRAGFDKQRLFYTQGDYGLFQSVVPSDQNTYDNEEWVMAAMEAQGFFKDEHEIFQVPSDGKLLMKLPSSLIPKCSDGSDVEMNLRADNSFVEDAGWHLASQRYARFLNTHSHQHVLYLELGVGANTPIIIKYPFWAMTLSNPESVYACLNYSEAFCPDQIAKRSICIDGDIGDVLNRLAA